jgi:hypothetical protein
MGCRTATCRTSPTPTARTSGASGRSSSPSASRSITPTSRSRSRARALYKRTADRIRDAILRCGDREREIRAACVAGEIGNDDPHWVMNHALGPGG